MQYILQTQIKHNTFDDIEKSIFTMQYIQQCKNVCSLNVLFTHHSTHFLTPTTIIPSLMLHYFFTHTFAYIHIE